MEVTGPIVGDISGFRPLTSAVTEGVGGGLSAAAATARADAILASPHPNVTVGTPVASTTATTVPNSLLVNAWDRLGTNTLDTRLAQQCGLAMQATGVFPQYDYAASKSSIITYAPGVITTVAMSYSFTYNGGALDVLLRYGGANSGSVVDIYCDDQFVRTVAVADYTGSGVTIGNLLRVPLTITGGVARTYRIVCHSNMAFPGVVVDSTKTTTAPATSAPRVLFVGDSYVEGGSAYPDRDFTDWQYLMTGAKNVWKCGSGGTGYLAAGARTALKDRYTNDIINQAPDSVVAMMGLNDSAAYTADPATFSSTVTAIFSALKAALPSAKIVIFGPWSPQGPGYYNATLVSIDAALQTIAANAGLPFVSPLQQAWITGNGKAGATTGNGNSDIYISSDGTHPTPAGHKFIAAKVAASLRALGVL